MIEAPNVTEGYLIYAPLGLALMMACITECASERIPNGLSLAILLYALAARALVGPLPFGWYLLSLLVTGVLVIGVGWGRGHLGGGAAKLSIAVGSGLPPALTAAVAVALFCSVMVLIWTARWHGRERVPGSIVLTVATAAVLAGVAVWGHANSA